ncbi:hypothetical protein HK405_002722, partial [Cladochytrium tenue]
DESDDAADGSARSRRKQISQAFGSPQKKQSAPLLNAYGVPVTGGAHRSLRPSDMSDRIRVCVRKRPLNKKEQKNNQMDIAIVNS